MHTLLRAVLALGLLSGLAACGQPVEEPAYVETPVTAEPVYSGKYN